MEYLSKLRNIFHNRSLIKTAEYSFAALAVASSSPSFAEWQVTRYQDGCAVEQEYVGAGSTRVALMAFFEGEFGIEVTNAGWSSADGVEYPISIYLGEDAYTGNAIGVSRDSRRPGIYGDVQRQFVDAFAGARTMIVRRGDVIVDSLSLSGSASAVSRLDQCVRQYRGIAVAERRAREAEERRRQIVPIDPFSVTPSAPSNPHGPIPVGPLNSWIETSDYPLSALAENAEGTSYYRLTVNPDGEVISCEITRSSGTAALDQATCRNIQRRARFTAATNQSGDGIMGRYEGSYAWQLP